MTHLFASHLHVEIEPRYLDHESDPDQQQFVFSYTIHIHNAGDSSVRLLKRHWIITDSEGDVREVKGVGVVGQQPLIESNSTYSYTSGAVLNTELGFMEGNYTMRTHAGDEFDLAIPRFRLIPPFLLH